MLERLTHVNFFFITGITIVFEVHCFLWEGKFSGSTLFKLKKTASYIIGLEQALLIIYTLKLQFHEICMSQSSLPLNA
jgi:hypothetical protein